MTEKASAIIDELASTDRKRSASAAAKQLARTIVKAIQSKKGRHIVVIDMDEVSGIADYFVLCTGDSDTQIKAIADAVKYDVSHEHGEHPWRTEGYTHRQWVLVDYVDVVVHIFDVERRDYYNLERLWADAPMEEIIEDTGSMGLLD